MYILNRKHDLHKNLHLQKLSHYMITITPITHTLLGMQDGGTSAIGVMLGQQSFLA